MAGEFAVINPRRRRRKKVHARKRKTHRRRSYARAHNPVRHRRRHVARRHHARRRYARRHNPAFMGMPLGQIVSAAGGFVGTSLLAGYLKGMLPATMTADANQANMIRIGCKAAVAIGVPMLGKSFLPRNIRNALMLGGGVAVAVDIFETFIKPAIPGLPFADYEQGYIADYEQSAPQLMGSESVYGESIY